VGSARYNPEIAALLTIVEAQVRVSRSILDYLEHRGVPGTELAGPHAQLDQLHAAIAEANVRLLPPEPEAGSPGGLVHFAGDGE
jgi:hypothetical protein